MAVFTKVAPTVGGSSDTWGTTLNQNWENLSTFFGSLDSDELAVLSGITADTTELNLLSGVPPTTDLSFVDGVTSAIQTQIDAKVEETRTITTGVGLTGGGDLSADLTIDGATQDAAAWEAGTEATESLVSPAKVKAAVEALAPTPTLSATQDTTSGSSVDFTGIPSTATEIDVYFIGYTNTGSSRVQFRVGGSVVTSGYYSSSGSSGAESGATTDGFVIYNDGLTRQHNGIMSLRKAASGTWVESHSLTAGGAEVNGGGSCTGLGAVDGIRVKATGVFQAGEVSVSWR